MDSLRGGTNIPFGDHKSVCGQMVISTLMVTSIKNNRWGLGWAVWVTSSWLQPSKHPDHMIGTFIQLPPNPCLSETLTGTRMHFCTQTEAIQSLRPIFQFTITENQLLSVINNIQIDTCQFYQYPFLKAFKIRSRQEAFRLVVQQVNVIHSPHHRLDYRNSELRGSDGRMGEGVYSK